MAPTARVSAVGPARPLAPVTDLNVFRRDRTVNDWIMIFFIVGFCVLTGMLGAKVSPLVAQSATAWIEGSS